MFIELKIGARQALLLTQWDKRCWQRFERSCIPFHNLKLHDFIKHGPHTLYLISVQLSPHVLRVKRLKIVKIDATGLKLCSCMLRYQSAVLFRRNGELCLHISNAIQDMVYSNVPWTEKSKSGGSSLEAPPA